MTMDPNRKSLELLALAIADFLDSPESEAKFSGLDWLLRVVTAQWGEYALTRRVEASRAMLHHSPGDNR
jgi:hypothetical protein